MAVLQMSAYPIGPGIGQPAEHLFLITASDTADLPFVTRAIRVGTAGNLAVLTTASELVTIPLVLAGETIAVQATRVYSTNTTASNIMGLA